MTGALIAGGLGGATLAGASSARASSAGANTAAIRPDTLSTVAGGVGGPDVATNVALAPCGLRYADGALLVGTGDAIRRIDPVTDWLTNVAGDGAAGDDAGNPPATGRAIGACDVATDAHGNIVFADDAGSAVDVIPKSNGTFYGRHMTAGHLYTIDTIELDGPIVDVEPDRQGNLLLSVDGFVEGRGESPNGAHVYVLAEKTGTFYGQRMTAGRQYTIVGTTFQDTRPRDGLPAIEAALGGSVGNLRIDRNGNIVLADPIDPPNSGNPGVYGTNVPSSLVLVVAEKAGTFYGMKMRPQRIYVLAGNSGKTGNGGNGVPGPDASLKTSLRASSTPVTVGPLARRASPPRRSRWTAAVTCCSPRSPAGSSRSRSGTAPSTASRCGPTTSTRWRATARPTAVPTTTRVMAVPPPAPSLRRSASPTTGHWD